MKLLPPARHCWYSIPFGIHTSNEILIIVIYFENGFSFLDEHSLIKLLFSCFFCCGKLVAKTMWTLWMSGLRISQLHVYFDSNMYYDIHTTIERLILRRLHVWVTTRFNQTNPYSSILSHICLIISFLLSSFIIITCSFNYFHLYWYLNIHVHPIISNPLCYIRWISFILFIFNPLYALLLICLIIFTLFCS